MGRIGELIHMDLLSQAFAAELRDKRKAARLSQEELAELAGIHRTYVSLLERGVKNPTLHVLFRLASVLHVSPTDFIQAVSNRASDYRAGDVD